MIKKYVDFINEAEEVEADAQVQSEKETDASDSSKFMDVKEEIKSMIEKTIKNSGGEYSSFVQSFLKNPEDVKVDGFINDSDIYDFYLKWRNDIDEVLNDVKYFDETPTENNSFGLYEYIIKSTQRAFEEFMRQMK